MTPSEIAALLAEVEAAQEWMRHPDFSDDMSLADIADWLNERPTSLLPKVATALRAQAERIKALEAALHDVIYTDHHNHFDGDPPRFVQIARAALSQEPPHA